MRLAVAGFGNVGQALVRLACASRAGVGSDVSVVAVSDPRFGTAIDARGLDGGVLLDAVDGVGDFSKLDSHRPGLDTVGMINDAPADVFVELTFTDLETGQPATRHIEAAIDAGMCVSTTNKGPIALHLPALERRASGAGVRLAYEGTVMSGTPAIAVARDTVRPAGFRGVAGLLNGTTNYMLSRAAEGLHYDVALREAQENGYAEADPTGDVDGHDMAAKLVILARVLTGRVLAMSAVDRRPLSDVAADDVAAARSKGRCWKYVAELGFDGDRVVASVGPKELPLTHPLAGVGGATNALTFSTDLLGDVTLIGPGAGRDETAVAVLSDLLAIGRECR
jgi:homoserine dehydrogenase